MRKFILLFAVLFSFLNSIAQNCDNEEAQRHMLAAEELQEMIKNPEDIQLVADEYEKAAQYAPYCAGIYYNLGLCYDKLGKKQPELFDKAVACYQKYLRLKPDAENRNDVENRIYTIGREKEMYQRQQNKELEKWCGKWYMHYTWKTNSGRIIESHDQVRFFEIFIDQGSLYAKVIAIWVEDEDNNSYKDNKYRIVPVVLKDDYILVAFTYEYKYYYNHGTDKVSNTWNMSYKLYLVSPNRMEGEWLGGMGNAQTLVSFYFERQ